MSSKYKHPALIWVLFGVVAVLGLVTTNRLASPQGGAPLDVQPEGIPNAPAEQTTAEEALGTDTPQSTLVIPPTLLLIRDGATTRIIQREYPKDTKMITNRTLFTDADETNKLQQIIGLNSTHVYALVGVDPSGSGQVARITLDGTGRLELVSETILASSVPAVRPDGQRLALVTFDNAERSFGFTLKTQTLKGEGEKSIDTSETGIALPRWSADGTQLAFTKGQATPEAGQELRVSANEGSPNTVYTTEQNMAVTDLTWAGTSTLLLVLEPLGNETQNQAKLVKLSLSDKTVSDFVDAEGKERGLVASPDGTLAGFVSGKVPAGTSLPAGPVTVRSLTSDQSLTLGQAASVIGWVR